MLATQKIMVLSTVLLTVPPAHADQNTAADSPLFFVVPEQPHDAQLRSADWDPGWVEPIFRVSNFDPSIKSETQNIQGKDARFAADPRASLHWDTTAQRPSLVYQFSDNGVLHFHGSRHGAMISVTWSIN